MGSVFWFKRFAWAFVLALPLLSLVQWFKGSAFEAAWMFGLLWSAISAAVFTWVGYLRYRRNPACMLPSANSKHDGST